MKSYVLVLIFFGSLFFASCQKDDLRTSVLEVQGSGVWVDQHLDALSNVPDSVWAVFQEMGVVVLVNNDPLSSSLSYRKDLQQQVDFSLYAEVYDGLSPMRVREYALQHAGEYAFVKERLLVLGSPVKVKGFAVETNTLYLVGYMYAALVDNLPEPPKPRVKDQYAKSLAPDVYHWHLYAIEFSQQHKTKKGGIQ